MIILGPALGALVLHAQENRQAAQRRIAGRRVGVAHRAVVFPKRAVAPVVLAVFDRRPVFAQGGEQLVRRRVRGGTAGEAADIGDRRLGRVGRLPDVSFDAHQLRRAGETGGEGVRRDSPDAAPLAPAVALVDGLGVGVRGGVVARLRRARTEGAKPPGNLPWAWASSVGWLPLARTR